jgi:hypothetical protein
MTLAKSLIQVRRGLMYEVGSWPLSFEGARGMFRVVVHRNKQRYVWRRTTIEEAIRAGLATRSTEDLWAERIEDDRGSVVVTRAELDALFLALRIRVRDSA